MPIGPRTRREQGRIDICRHLLSNAVRTRLKRKPIGSAANRFIVNMDLRMLWIFLTHAASYGTSLLGYVLLAVAVNHMEDSENIEKRERGQTVYYALTALAAALCFALYILAIWLTVCLGRVSVPQWYIIVHWLMVLIMIMLVLVPVVQHSMGHQSELSAVVSNFAVPYIASLWVLMLIPFIRNWISDRGASDVEGKENGFVTTPPRL